MALDVVTRLLGLRGKLLRRKALGESRAEDLSDPATEGEIRLDDEGGDGKENTPEVENVESPAEAVLQPTGEAELSREAELSTKLRQESAKESNGGEGEASESSLANLFESVGGDEDSPTKGLIALLPDIPTSELLEELRQTKELLQRWGWTGGAGGKLESGG